MGHTMSEKILLDHLREGQFARGSEVGVSVDQCLTQDSTGTLAWLEFESLGLDTVAADLVVSYCDHTSLAFKGESADDHEFLRSMASRYGAKFSRAGNGVCHQVHLERFAVPTRTLLGSDSHTPTCGALGMLAIGAGGMDVAVAIGGGLLYLTVPKMMRVSLSGRLGVNVGAKDVALEVVRRLTVRGGDGFILEYSGPGVSTLSIQQRATIANMSAEVGAMTAMFPSDEVARDFLRSQQRESDWLPHGPDRNAQYDDEIEIDLGDLEPLVAMPHSPDNVVGVSEVVGKTVGQVFVGSCTNGSFEDIAAVAEFLEGKTVDGNVDLVISPGSRQVWQMLLDDGSFAVLSSAGARMIDPGCNACIGMGFVPASGQLSLRTVNRNYAGRGGNKASSVALCGPEVAAVSALEGRIADPREYTRKSRTSSRPIVDDSRVIEPVGAATGATRSNSIAPFGRQSPLADVLCGTVLIKLGDGVSTDTIIPAGPLTQHLRSNLPATAAYVFHYIDPTFAQRAVDSQGGFIVAGENYGQGSSREHAALGPWKLGVRAVLAKSIARIHRANLINAGIVPLTLDTDSLEPGDTLVIGTTELDRPVEIANNTQGVVLVGMHGMTERERAIVKAGGLLAYSEQLR